jgi:hypothetical protein
MRVDIREKPSRTAAQFFVYLPVNIGNRIENSIFSSFMINCIHLGVMPHPHQQSDVFTKPHTRLCLALRG